ncbi:hypothetical protein CEE34_11080 [Candidatus Aerophobetes bacterium Ae_b3a]|nr:MAG: hypothetical protein CEE34_11080 [Candidatus Aerophobetes bacterium Ae_b3a]
MLKTHEIIKIREKRRFGGFLSVQRGLLVFTFIIFLICGPQTALSTSEKSYDVLIKGGTIYDGTLKPPYVADIGIKNDKIAAIRILSGEANKTLDASGFIVTPGFIDIHEHSDVLLDMIASGEGFDFTPAMKENLKGNFNALYQGVTTVVTGNCGNGISDMDRWFAMIESMNFGTNVMHLVPHGKLRQELFGPENQPGELNSKQLGQLKARLEEEMKKGACGMSTGLAYSPGIAARTEELIELAKIVEKYGGIYATHMRDESGMVLEDGRIALLESIREAIEIGRKAGVPVQISHLKLAAPFGGVKASQILGLIKEARREGLDITADSYPYTAGFTEISILLPARFKKPEGGIADDYKTEEGREEIKDFIQEIFTDIPPEKIKLVLADEPTYQGKTLKEIAALEGKDSAECYADLVCDHAIAGIIFALNEQTMRDFMPNHYVFTSSDGMTWPEGISGGAHPRYFGAFARKLKVFAIDEELMRFNDAIRSMTYLPAEKLGLKGRGKIEEGAFADIVVLDLNTLTDKSTYEEPNAYAEGIVHLLVNGVVTIENQRLTGRRGGMVLRGRGKTEDQ